APISPRSVKLSTKAVRTPSNPGAHVPCTAGMDRTGWKVSLMRAPIERTVFERTVFGRTVFEWTGTEPRRCGQFSEIVGADSPPAPRPLRVQAFRDRIAAN